MSGSTTPGRPVPAQRHGHAGLPAGSCPRGRPRPQGAVGHDHRAFGAQPAYSRPRRHDQGDRHPAGPGPPGDHRHQPHLRRRPHRRDRRHHRFPTSAKLARYTGCALIPVYSSDQERHRLHRGGNRRLNSVLYTAAIV
ncbi:transposase [Nonomuraea sp. 3N208]|uniref:transposase n=1 Tax=Nonomuraea sp. 3N208 TaxID=3457421 RepID=UPI003FD19872